MRWPPAEIRREYLDSACHDPHAREIQIIYFVHTQHCINRG